MNYQITLDATTGKDLKLLPKLVGKSPLTMSFGPESITFTGMGANSCVIRTSVVAKPLGEVPEDSLIISHNCLVYLASCIGTVTTITADSERFNIATPDGTQSFTETEGTLLSVPVTEIVDSLSRDEVLRILSMAVAKDSKLGVLYSGDQAMCTDTFVVGHTYLEGEAIAPISIPIKLIEIAKRVGAESMSLSVSPTHASISTGTVNFTMPKEHVTDDEINSYATNLPKFIETVKAGEVIVVDTKKLLVCLDRISLDNTEDPITLTIGDDELHMTSPNSMQSVKYETEPDEVQWDNTVQVYAHSLRRIIGHLKVPKVSLWRQDEGLLILAETEDITLGTTVQL